MIRSSSMLWRIPVLLGALSALAGLGAAGCDDAAARAGAGRSSAPITVATLRSSKVIGDLGVPLGTLVTVEGVVLPDDARRRKEDMGAILLRVRRVNGRALHTPFIATLRGGATVRALRPGARVKAIAYEAGGFSGAPHGLFKHVPAFTTKGFGFSTWVDIVKLVP